MRDVFSDIYHQNSWKGDDSVSGKGSDLKQTAAIQKAIPKLLKRLEVKTMLDIPCGDLFWLKEMELKLKLYLGADIVPEIIFNNRLEFPDEHFAVLDVTQDDLPQVDLILCRDLLGHFSNFDVKLALRNMKRSGSTYLLTTTFPGRENVRDIETGEWRPINLASMFGLPNPIELINERCTEGNGAYADKSLGLWRLNT